MSAPLLIPWFRWTPIVIDVGGRELLLYPFQLAAGVAVVVVLSVAVLFARKHGRSVELTLDFAVHVLLFAFPVSLLLNGVLYEPDAFQRLLEEPLDPRNLRLGWSLYGGILGGILGAWVWKWRRGDSMVEVSDALAFAGPFGWAVARIGCFGVHDHPGRASDFFLAVADYRVGTPPYLPRHDLGLYDAILLAGIASVFLGLSRSRRKPGIYLALLALLYTPARFLLDFLRAPAAEGGDLRYLGLTPSQYASIGLFIAGVGVWHRVRSSSSAPS